MRQPIKIEKDPDSTSLSTTHLASSISPTCSNDAAILMTSDGRPSVVAKADGGAFLIQDMKDDKEKKDGSH